MTLLLHQMSLAVIDCPPVDGEPSDAELGAIQARMDGLPDSVEEWTATIKDMDIWKYMPLWDSGWRRRDW